MTEAEVANEQAINQDVGEDEEMKVNKKARDAYLDPEGGYTNTETGRAAEIAAMTRQAPVSVNNLPTKAYLEATITPTVLRALTEVSRARPDNPLEFVAYYLLKHNPNRQVKTEGEPIGHRHPEDKADMPKTQDGGLSSAMDTTK